MPKRHLNSSAYPPKVGGGEGGEEEEGEDEKVHLKTDSSISGDHGTMGKNTC